jgi:hypothetical protein
MQISPAISSDFFTTSRADSSQWSSSAYAAASA